MDVSHVLRACRLHRYVVLDFSTATRATVPVGLELRSPVIKMPPAAPPPSRLLGPASLLLRVASAHVVCSFVDRLGVKFLWGFAAGRLRNVLALAAAPTDSPRTPLPPTAAGAAHLLAATQPLPSAALQLPFAAAAPPLAAVLHPSPVTLDLGLIPPCPLAAFLPCADSRLETSSPYLTPFMVSCEKTAIDNVLAAAHAAPAALAAPAAPISRPTSESLPPTTAAAATHLRAAQLLPAAVLPPPRPAAAAVDLIAFAYCKDVSGTIPQLQGAAGAFF